MRLSAWSSDVCSSDLEPRAAAGGPGGLPGRVRLQLARGSGDFDGGRDRLRRRCGADGATRAGLGRPAARSPVGAPHGRDGPYRGKAIAPMGRSYTWRPGLAIIRSEEHTSELQSLMRISYAVFRLKK